MEDGGHLVKQDGYNSSSYIWSDLLALWIHAIWWAFIFSGKVASFNAVKAFFTDKYSVMPGGNCTIHRINTQNYIQEWIMVCVPHHRLLQVSADIVLSSDEGWEIKRVCQFPLIIWGCALRSHWQNKCLSIRGDKGQQARFSLLVTTWFCIKIWTIRHSDCPWNFNWKMFFFLNQGSICQLCVIYLYYIIYI